MRNYEHHSSRDEVRVIAGREIALPARVHAKMRAEDGHWLWTASLTTSGYGSITWKGRHVPSHRFVYERLVGTIPSGLDLDHLCRVRHCVNPAHLEPVTRGENTLRGVAPAANAVRTNQCFRGHVLTDDNVRRGRGNIRYCRKCDAIRSAARKRREREARHERGLEPPIWELQRAQTHCARGHEFNQTNTEYRNDGRRECRTCRRMRRNAQKEIHA